MEDLKGQRKEDLKGKRKEDLKEKRKDWWKGTRQSRGEWLLFQGKGKKRGSCLYLLIIFLPFYNFRSHPVGCSHNRGPLLLTSSQLSRKSEISCLCVSEEKA